MELMAIYNTLSDILCALDYEALFPGFRRYPFAIYTQGEVCLDGKLLPYEDCFRGNTSILYQGENTAIWNCEADPIVDLEILAYQMVHEMFHCHQLANKESVFPSDLALLNYPDDIVNFTSKYNENLYLAACYEKEDVVYLKKFITLREQRLRRYPDMVRQELRAETIEGMAEFIGLKALRVIDTRKFAEILGEYTHLLRGESDLLFDVRKISYYTGALYFLCLERLGYSVNRDFASSLTAFEQNIIVDNAAAAEIRNFSFIAEQHAAYVSKKKEAIATFVAGARYKACTAEICGYDPMNMFRAGDMIFCSHFVSLKEESRTKTYMRPIGLEMDGNSERRVRGYYLEDRDHV